MHPIPSLLAASLVLAGVCAAQKPIGEVESGDATVRGSVSIGPTGTTLMSGSQVSAGEKIARVRLTRGGELDVCPNSSLTVTSSARGDQNLIALNSGTVETHYSLASESDSIVTPDFRIQLPGPGAFHVAVSVTPRGDTCVESLQGNSSSVIVNEQMGDGTHQVRPGERVMFKNGAVSGADLKYATPCGCIAPKSDKKAEDPELKFPEEQSRQAAETAKHEPEKPKVAPQDDQSLTAPPPTTASGGETTQVDVPMVYRAPEKKDPVPAAATPAAPVQTAQAQTAPTPSTAQASVPVTPTDQSQLPEKKPKKNFFQKIGSAIAGFFKRKS